MKSLLYFSALLFCLSCGKSYDTEIKVEKLAESNLSWNGAALPAYAEGTPKVTILKITIPPKTKLHVHKHLVINAGVLLTGELTVHDELGNTLEMKAGDALIELVNAYHYGINNGTIPAEIIVVYAGTEGVPITVLKEE